MNKRQIELEKRREQFEKGCAVAIKRIIEKRKIFPKSGQGLLMAAAKGEDLPNVRFKITKTRKKFIQFFKDERKDFEKRGFKLPPEYIREQNRLAEQRELAKKKRSLNYAHFLSYKDSERPFFDFSPVEQY